MSDAEEKQITPETVLMNCLGNADRIKHIVIVTYTKDGCYEYWSNDLPAHVRLGLLRENVVHIERGVFKSVD